MVSVVFEIHHLIHLLVAVILISFSKYGHGETLGEYITSITSKCYILKFKFVCIYNLPLQCVYIDISLAMVNSRNVTVGNSLVVCDGEAIEFVCTHPPISTEVNNSRIFRTSAPNWSNGNSIIFHNTVDGISTYSKGNNQTVLKINHLRSETDLTIYNFTCFIPLASGGILQSNQMPLYISSEYAYACMCFI